MISLLLRTIFYKTCILILGINMKNNLYKFHHTFTAEPHHFRRKEMLKKYPDIRSLMGYDRKIAWINFFVVVVQLLLAVKVQKIFESHEFSNTDWFLYFLFTYLIGGSLAHWASMAIHEASHNTAAKSRNGNRLVGLWANLIMVVPAAMSLRKHHPHHHVNMGVLGKDQDIPRSWVKDWVGNKSFRKFLWITFYILFAIVSTGRIGKQNKYELLNIFTQILANLAIYLLIGPFAFYYICLSMFCGHTFNPISAHFIHEHYSDDGVQETFSYYGPINWITYNVGYHTEHHDFMNIPGTRLPELKKIAPEYYDSIVSHRSWFLVHLNFIFNKNYGHFCRITRDNRNGSTDSEKLKNSQNSNLFPEIKNVARG